MNRNQIETPEFTIAISQLGYLPDSPKSISMVVPPALVETLLDTIPFYVQKVGSRLKRQQVKHPMWEDKIFRWPFGISQGAIEKPIRNYLSETEQPMLVGELRKNQSSWGVFWQGNFDEFDKEGIYQIETEFGFSTPFAIQKEIYGRLHHAFIQYTYAQRSGMEIPNIRMAENCDDGILDYDDTPIPAAGGWNDAGDFRKWLCFTQFTIGALVDVYKNGHSAYRNQIIDELRWGNLYFHAMIDRDGLVYEDLGAGDIRKGTTYEEDWWWENHPGVTATGIPGTDNIPLSGDERKIRTSYNPWVQFGFIRNQCQAASVMSPAESNNCIILAKRAWNYSQQNKHDGHTLFASAELHAALELHAYNVNWVSIQTLEELIGKLFSLQNVDNDKIKGFFYENGTKKDGFRSIAFSADPAWALLKVLQTKPKINNEIYTKVQDHLRCYLDHYLIADSNSNPFYITPYGTYINPPFPEEQTFRPAGGDVFIRTFLHPLNSQQVPHGGNSVLLSHAYLLAQSGVFFSRSEYIHQSEKLLHWTLGNNPFGLCFFTDIGFKHPTPASFENQKIPYAAVSGCIGNFDDTPYIEISNAVEWSTQEVWDVPMIYASGTVSAIQQYYHHQIKEQTK